jgi:hypothetical protein
MENHDYSYLEVVSRICEDTYTQVCGSRQPANTTVSPFATPLPSPAPSPSPNAASPLPSGSSSSTAHEVIIVPLLSWYHHSFDLSDPSPGRLRADKYCIWPVDEVDGLWQLMLALNRPAISTVAAYLTREGRLAATAVASARTSPLTISPAAGFALDGVDTASPAAPRLTAGVAIDGVDLAPAGPSGADGCGARVSATGAGDDTDATATITAARSHPAVQAAGTVAVKHVVHVPTIITASHFLPHPALPFNRGAPMCVWVDAAVWELPVAGCAQLVDVQVEQCGRGFSRFKI